MTRTEATVTIDVPPERGGAHVLDLDGVPELVRARVFGFAVGTAEVPSVSEGPPAREPPAARTVDSAR